MGEAVAAELLSNEMENAAQLSEVVIELHSVAAQQDYSCVFELVLSARVLCAFS